MYVHSPTEQSPAVELHPLRVRNAGRVLQRVWTAEEGISRAALARELELSRSTVSAIVNELMASGLICEWQLTRSRGGRPGMLLRFPDERFHIIGIELGSAHVDVCLTDGRTLVQHSVRHEHPVQHDPSGTLRLLHSAIQQCLDAAPPEAVVIGIGVAVPCPIDTSSDGRLSERILPAWREVRLAADLGRRFDMPVWLDNDANLGALAEHWWGAGRGASEMTYVKVATGVGAGHIIHGRLFRGAAGIAGEIGHTTVNAEGRVCRCGLQGCLEAEIGSPSIVAMAQEALRDGADSSLGSIDTVTIGAIVDASRRGDPLAVELIERAGRHLGVAVANLLNLLNPSLVVLGGRLTHAGPTLLTPLRNAVRERALWTSIERAAIVIGDLGEHHVAIGAATLVLDAALQQPSLFRSRPPGRADSNPSSRKQGFAAGSWP